MLDDLEAEYSRLREELLRLQRERARLDAQHPRNLDEERAHAIELRACYAELVAYLGRLERMKPRH